MKYTECIMQCTTLICDLKGLRSHMPCLSIPPNYSDAYIKNNYSLLIINKQEIKQRNWSCKSLAILLYRRQMEPLRRGARVQRPVFHFRRQIWAHPTVTSAPDIRLAPPPWHGYMSAVLGEIKEQLPRRMTWRIFINSCTVDTVCDVEHVLSGAAQLRCRIWID